MSYDKNTVLNGTIDTVRAMLEHAGMPYKIEVIGTLHDRGNGDGEIVLRRLTVGPFVLLERILHSSDCDSDDVVECLALRANDPHAANWHVRFEDDAMPDGTLGQPIEGLRATAKSD